jgi:hypothetical protein
MANGSIILSPQQIDALADQIKPQVPLSPPESFCRNWPTARGVLQMLHPILAAVPGLGLFAGPAIGVVIAAGDAAKKAGPMRRKWR